MSWVLCGLVKPFYSFVNLVHLVCLWNISMILSYLISFLACLLNMVSLQDNMCPYIFPMYLFTYFFDTWKFPSIYFCQYKSSTPFQVYINMHKRSSLLINHIIPHSKCCFASELSLSNQNIRDQDIWGTSLVAQCLRIHLPMQGTQVRSLVREDPTCCGAAKPMRHN